MPHGACHRSLGSRAFVALAGTFLWFFPCLASGQVQAQLPVEAVVDSHTFNYASPPQFSADGKWLAYGLNPLTRHNHGKATCTNESGSEVDCFYVTGVPGILTGQDIYVVNTEDGKSENLTSGNGSNWAPSWSPNGRYLAFLSDRDGSGQSKLWAWDCRRRELRKITDVSVRAIEIQWLPDSTQLLVTILPESSSPAASKTSTRLWANAAAEPTNPPRSTVVVYNSSRDLQQANPWTLDNAYPLRDLAMVDIVSGKVRRVGLSQRVAKYLISPDGSLVAFTSPTRFEKPGTQQTLFDIRTIRLADNEQQVVVHEIRLDLTGAAVSWSRDSLSLSYQVGGMEGNGDCYLVDVRGRTPKNLTRLSQQPPHYSVEPPLWDIKGSCFYVINDGVVWKADANQGRAVEFSKIPNHSFLRLLSQREGALYSPEGGGGSTIALVQDNDTKRTAFYEIDLETGAARSTYQTDQCLTCVLQFPLVAVSMDGRELAYFAGDAQHDVNLWLTDPEFSRPRRLTNINPQFDKYQMGAARLVEWTSLDGQQLKGALLLPSDYKEGKRFPLIVSVYGGENGSQRVSRFGLVHGVNNFQLLATRGYAVLCPDAPQHLGTPLADLSKTVLPGVDKVIQMGIADPERVGVLGHSYGGYSTLALLVQTKRFKAAMVSAGFGDLVGIYGEMADDGASYGTPLAEGGQGLMGGTPWEFRERYIENSPIFYLDRIETPLLIVHGGADKFVDPFLAAQVFVGLRRLGKAAEFARYVGEGHDPNFWSRANEVDYCNRVITWFDRYLKAVPPPKVRSLSSQVRSRRHSKLNL